MNAGLRHLEGHSDLVPAPGWRIATAKSKDTSLVVVSDVVAFQGDGVGTLWLRPVIQEIHPVYAECLAPVQLDTAYDAVLVPPGHSVSALCRERWGNDWTRRYITGRDVWRLGVRFPPPSSHELRPVPDIIGTARSYGADPLPLPGLDEAAVA